MFLMSNNYKNVKGVKGMLRVRNHTLNTSKALPIKPFKLHVKHVKGTTCARARVRKIQQYQIKNIIKNNNISTREKYTLNILNELNKPYVASLSNVKGIKCTLNTLNIENNKV